MSERFEGISPPSSLSTLHPLYINVGIIVLWGSILDQCGFGRTNVYDESD